MTNTLQRTSPDTSQLLSRLLEQPGLLSAVRRLDGRALHRLIEHVGLEDAGELLAMVTTRQLEQLFDEDLWQSEQIGQDARFDPDRFGLWLEVMLEAGDAFAAQKLTELPEELVLMALSSHLMVLDLDALVEDLAWDHRGELQRIEKALDSLAYLELEEYRVIARRADGSDALFEVLTALDRDHFETLSRWLDRLATVTAEEIEDEGLYDVLTAEELLVADAAADREDRRARQGFVAPSAATAFLALARTTTLETLLGEETDPTTRLHFRHLAPPRTTRSSHRARTPRPDGAHPDPLTALLIEADVLPSAPPGAGLLGAGAAEGPDVVRALADLSASDATLHATRMQELAYLANLVMAGCGIEGRPMRATEATEAVLTTCNLGLELVLQRTPNLTEPQALHIHSAVKLFRLGWRLLAEEAVWPTTTTVIAHLEAVQRQLDTSARRALEPALHRLRAARARHSPMPEQEDLLSLDPELLDALLPALRLIDGFPWRAGAQGEPTFFRSRADLRTARDVLRVASAVTIER